MRAVGRFAVVARTTVWGSLALPAVLSTLPAPTQAQVPERSWGTITGMVYDSLLRSPLINARVSLLNSSRSVKTDDQGRFVLDSVPEGTQALSFFRSDLDSIGLSSFVATVKVEAGRAINVALAVPSLSTYWRAACGRDYRGAAADSGLISGTVRDAETGHRIAGAQVSLSWVTVERQRRSRWVVEYPGRIVTTDSSGSYYLCGTPVEYLLAARARVGTFASGLIDVLVDIRGVVRRDLTVSRESVLGPADSGAGRRGLATIVGSVRGERGGLLPGAYASVDDVEGSVEADSLGRFVLRGLPSGTHMLMVRRIGYFASRQPVALRNRDTVRVNVPMAEATLLDTIRVTASPYLVPIVDRIEERRRAGFGYLVGPEEIRRHGTFRSVFEGFPLVEVRGSTSNFTIGFRKMSQFEGGPGNTVLARTGCTPEIFIDDYRADAEQLSVLNPQDIWAVEIYTHPNAGLFKYLSWNNDCGVILVWTRAAR
jgi:hypothetical protein